MRECHEVVFQQASNGLNLFLNEYPYMNEDQKQRIEEMIEVCSKSLIHHGNIRRQAVQCKVQPDGSIVISPWHIKKTS
jgi:hypothetical protein